MTKIAIIGAGFAGLTIATLLKHKAQITIFEKSRGIGGRMATRYAENFEFDHGAPFFNTTSVEFKEFLQPLLADGIITQWKPKLAAITLHATIYNLNPNIEECFVGTPKMNSISKYLARDANIKLETKIIKISPSGKQWQIRDDKNQEYEGFDFVITTTPPLQAVDILPSSCSYIKRIEQINMLPTFAVMLGFEDSVMQSKQWDIAYFQHSMLDLLIANHKKPFRKTSPSFTVFTTHEWTQKNIDINKDDVAKTTIMELENIFGEKLSPSIIQVHRWLYAKSELHTLNKSFFADMNSNLISCGDWCIKGNIEDAFKSGLAVSNYLKEILS